MNGDRIDEGGCVNTLTTYHPTPLAKGNGTHSMIVQSREGVREGRSMTQYGFYFDSTRCTGCRTCEMACKDYKDLPATTRSARCTTTRAALGADARRHLHADAFGLPRVAWPATTAQCRPAWPSCPPGAMEKDAETGLVPVDEEKCIGCGTA